MEVVSDANISASRARAVFAQRDANLVARARQDARVSQGRRIRNQPLQAPAKAAYRFEFVLCVHGRLAEDVSHLWRVGIRNCIDELVYTPIELALKFVAPFQLCAQ